MSRLVHLWLIPLLIFAANGTLSAQDSDFLPLPPDEIETIIDLLDAVDAVELAVLGGRDISPEEQRQIEHLARIGDALGADDLASRARALAVLARPARTPSPGQPELARPLGPSTQDAFVRGGGRFQTLAYTLGVTGATSLVLSATFSVFAERDYQRWVSLDEGADPAVGDELFQAWRGYDLLSLGLGGTALLSAGVGLPLLYAFSTPAPGGEMLPVVGPFTAEERDEQLLALYRERADVVDRLNRLDERGAWPDVVANVGTGVGVAGGITAVAMFYVAEELYQEYLAAPFSDQAVALGEQVRLFDLLAIVSAGVSAGGFGTSVLTRALTDDRERLETALRRVNREIVELRTAASFDVPQDVPQDVSQEVPQDEPLDPPQDVAPGTTADPDAEDAP